MEEEDNSTKDFAFRLNQALDDMNAPIRGRAQFLMRILPFVISANGIKKWLSGDAMPETSKIAAISEALGVRSMWLLWGEGHKSIPHSLLGKLNAFTEHEAMTEPQFSETTNTEQQDDAIYLSSSFKPKTAFPVESWGADTPLHDDEVEVKFLKSVEGAAGLGNHANELDNGYKLRFSKYTLQRLQIAPENAVCITVSGNSMEPQLPDGSTVGIDTGNKKIVDGKMYAVRHGDMVRIKVLYNLPGGGIRLRSYNDTEHPDETYSGQDVIDQHIAVIGRVFWSSVIY